MIFEKKTIKIIFKSNEDFRNRIPSLWQNQKEDEIYDFVFPDDQTKEEFEELMRSFI